MQATTKTKLRRTLRFLIAVASGVALGLGAFLVWFTVEWADAWGGEPDLAPGFGFLAAGAGLFMAQRSLRPRRLEPADTDDRS
jgi:hypothetical protein